MEIKPFVYLLLIFLFNCTRATGWKEESGYRAGVILELTLQAEVG